MNNGWIKIHRKILEWEWYSDVKTFRLFIHLLLKANHDDRRWMGITIKRGQLVTGRATLAKETGLSEQSIRTSLDRLKSTNEITIYPSPQYSVITVNNYLRYQEPTNEVTNKQPTNNQRVTTNKNNKNIRKYSLIGEVGEEEFADIANRYDVPIHFVRSVYDDMVNYCEGKGKSYTDYYATLRNWVKKEALKVKQGTHGKANIIYAGDTV